MTKLVRIAIAMMLTCPSLAAAPSEAVKGASSKVPSSDTDIKPAVLIKGNLNDYDPARDDTAAKSVISASELQKYGDLNILDALKRIPGITIGGRGQIMLRGLGSGYTQFLVNGERPPPGFSLASIHPSMVEKVEVMRAATAEYSTQAIAGTINVVLVSRVSTARRQAIVGYRQASGQQNTSATANIADRRGPFSYTFNATIANSNHDLGSTTIEELLAQVSSDSMRSRTIANRSQGDVDIFNVSQRMNWQTDDRQTINLNLGASTNRNHNSSMNREQFQTAPTLPFAAIDNSQLAVTSSYRADAGWGLKGSEFKGEIKSSVSVLTWKLRQQRMASDGGDGRTLASLITADSKQTSFGNNGKFSWQNATDHAFTTGWDVSHDKLQDAQIQVDTPADLGISTATRATIATSKAAVFAQDDFKVSSATSAYVGVRAEAVKTDVDLEKNTGTGNFAKVVSPILHLLYKLPKTKNQQLRASATRTFRAPPVSSFNARRSFSLNNSPTSPDQTGNPNIQPELSTGVDLTYENFIDQSTSLTVGVYAKSISHAIQQQLSQDPNSRWVSMPQNIGDAKVAGIELNARLPLSRLVATTLPVEIRLNLAKNRSSLNTIPGPGNRFAAQVPFSANLAVEYDATPIKAGVSAAFQKGGFTRTSFTLYEYAEYRRDVEAFLVWKASKTINLRVSASNLLGQDSVTASKYFLESRVIQSKTDIGPRGPLAQLNLEVGF